MSQTTFSDAVILCEKIFTIYNRLFFNEEIPMPEFCFGNNRYGTIDFKNILSINNQIAYRVKLPELILNQREYELAGCIVHNMIHLYGHIYQKRMSSNCDTYHNKRFKKKALQCGLSWTNDPLGSATEPSESFIKQFEGYNIKKTWGNKYCLTGTNSAKSNSIKYVDGVTGETVRATKKHTIFILDDCPGDVINAVQKLTGKSPCNVSYD